MQNLEFIETLTVEQFKDRVKVNEIKVKRNPQTSKLFIQFGSEVGACASKGIPEKPMLSNVRGENGEFWLLHEEGNGGEVLATF